MTFMNCWSCIRAEMNLYNFELNRKPYFYSAISDFLLYSKNSFSNLHDLLNNIIIDAIIVKQIV